VPILHSISDTVVRVMVRTRLYQEPRKDGRSGETSGKTGRHQWNKGLRLKEATISEGGENIRQDLWEDHWAGDCEAHGRVLCHDSKNE
jgi:hypothetical protein